MKLELTEEFLAVNALQKKTNKQFVIYTCVTNGYSRVLPAPKPLLEQFDFILFSDQEKAVDGWTYIKWTKSDEDPRRDAKFCKVNPHRILTAYEVSLWVDGNFKLKVGIKDLVQLLLNSDEVILLFHHRRRTCVYAEGQECLKWGKDSHALIKKQLNSYKASGHPSNWGLFMGGFLMRKHKSENCAATMEDWWNEIQSYSVRDQLSLPVVLRRNSTKMIVYKSSSTDPYFTVLPHLKYRSNCMTGRNLFNPLAILAPLIYKIATWLNGSGN
jgi:hypothetical protein